MPSNRKHPAWWQLYIGLPLLCGLFVLEIDLNLGQTANIIAQLLILGLIFVYVRVWLHANRGVLMELDENAPERQEPWATRVYQFPAAEPVTRARSSTVPRLPVDIQQGEIKGVLDTTFEIEPEEADSLFQPGSHRPHAGDVLPREHLHSPAHKE